MTNRIVRFLFPLFLSAPLLAYQGGTTRPHNHTSAAGDGGQLSNISLGGLTAAANVTVSSNVAIGTTTTPTYTLDTLGDIETTATGAAAVRGIISKQVSNDQASAHYSGAKARGTPLSLSPVQSLDYITALIANPYDGANYLIPAIAAFQVSPSTTVALLRVPTDFVVTTGTGTPADGIERLRISYAGNMGINKGGVTDNSGTFSVTALTGISAGRFISTDNTFTTVYITQGGSAAALFLDSASNALSVSGAGAPPNSQALCFLAGKLGHCSSVVGAGGGCTCSQP